MALRRGSVFSKGPPPAATLSVHVATVSLRGKAALNSKVLVEVDMPGKEDELTRSEPIPVKLGEAKVNLLARYEVGDADSPVRAALIAALQTEDEDDSLLLINVKSISENGAEVLLGSAQ